MDKNNREMEEFALKLALDSIRHFMKSQTPMKVKEEDIQFPELKEARGCFVTINLQGDLRGCIGNIEPEKTLYQSIIKNAMLAAFYDPRFYPLAESEIDGIEIEISILSRPEELEFGSPEELLKKLNSNVGVILQKGRKSATFLPQVWGQVPKKEEFLSELCMKAGLGADEWKKEGLKVRIYTAEIIKMSQ